MMSNFLELAQTTRPQSVPPLYVLLLAVVLLGVPLSLREVIRRRLWQLPPIPAGPEEGTLSVFGGTMLAAFAAYMGIFAILAHLMGLTPEIIKTAAGIRLSIMFQPAAQVTALVVALGLLRQVDVLPDAIQWAKPQKRDFATAIGCYLLAIPWVMLSGMLVELLIRLTSLKTSKGHMIFDIWRGEGTGLTAFKITAFVSVTILAPLTEELIFRGLLQRFIYKLTGLPSLSIIVASLAFAATHQPWAIQPPIFVLAVILGWTYFRTGNLLLVVLIHAIFNFLQIGLFSLTGA